MPKLRARDASKRLRKIKGKRKRNENEELIDSLAPKIILQLVRSKLPFSKIPVPSKSWVFSFGVNQQKSVWTFFIGFI